MDVSLKSYLKESVINVAYDTKIETMNSYWSLANDISKIGARFATIWQMVGPALKNIDGSVNLRSSFVSQLDIFLRMNDEDDYTFDSYDVSISYERSSLSAVEFEKSIMNLMKSIRNMTICVDINKWNKYFADIESNMETVVNEIMCIEEEATRITLNEEYAENYKFYTLENISTVTDIDSIDRNMEIIFKNINYLFHIIINIASAIAFHVNTSNPLEFGGDNPADISELLFGENGLINMMRPKEESNEPEEDDNDF